jgi:hypothetical protein
MTALGQKQKWQLEFVMSSSPDSRYCLGPSDCLAASQHTLFRNSLVLLVQIPDPIFKLAVGALWQTCHDHVDPTCRGILAALIWPIGDHLANAELVG